MTAWVPNPCPWLRPDRDGVQDALDLEELRRVVLPLLLAQAREGEDEADTLVLILQGVVEDLPGARNDVPGLGLQASLFAMKGQVPSTNLKA